MRRILAAIAAIFRRPLCMGRPDACDPMCPGWVWSQSDEYGWQLERCDECSRFADDDHAGEHVQTCNACARAMAADVIATR